MKLALSKSKPYAINKEFDPVGYTGNGSTQSITTSVGLLNHSGMVWLKDRAAGSHVLVDTERGAGYILTTDTTAASTLDSDTLTAFNSNGFSIGADTKINDNGHSNISWSFRSGNKFFDFSTLTKSSGSDASIDFPTLSTLGMVLVKRTDSVGDWYVWHRSLSAGNLLKLNSTDAQGVLGHVEVSGTTVTLKNGTISDGSYIIYAFAHSIHASSKIQCGTYEGNGSTTGPEINLGWTPQFLIIKNIDGAGYWACYDAERSTTNPREHQLMLGSTTAENTGSNYYLDFTATGFQPKASSGSINKVGDTHVYLAIREAL